MAKGAAGRSDFGDVCSAQDLVRNLGGLVYSIDGGHGRGGDSRWSGEGRTEERRSRCFPAAGGCCKAEQRRNAEMG